MKKVDKLDRKILRVISVDARRSFKEIAEQCGVSRAAIHQRVVRMFERGTITGSGYQINPKFLGFGTCSTSASSSRKAACIMPSCRN